MGASKHWGRSVARGNRSWASMWKKTTEEPIELGGVVALGTSQEVQALDLRLEILVFCGVYIVDIVYLDPASVTQ